MAAFQKPRKYDATHGILAALKIGCSRHMKELHLITLNYSSFLVGPQWSHAMEPLYQSVVAGFSIRAGAALERIARRAEVISCYN